MQVIHSSLSHLVHGENKMNTIKGKKEVKLDNMWPPYVSPLFLLIH